MVRPSFATRSTHSRSRGTSRATKYGELVLRVWQRCAHHLSPATGDWNSAGTHLCALGRRGLEQLAGPESSGHAWLVHPRDAWMGFQLHDCRCPHSYGTSVSLRSPQISPRTDLDHWSLSLIDDSRHGVHRSSHAF